MRLQLWINLGNEAMQTYRDLRGALMAVTAQMIPTANGQAPVKRAAPALLDGRKILDRDHNEVGEWAIIQETDRTPRTLYQVGASVALYNHTDKARTHWNFMTDDAMWAAYEGMGSIRRTNDVIPMWGVYAIDVFDKDGLVVVMGYCPTRKEAESLADRLSI